MTGIFARRRLFLLLTIAVSFAGKYAVRANEPQTSEAPHDAPYTSSSESNTDHAIHVNGSGRQASQKFELKAGLAIVQVQNDGKSNFVVGLVDGQGEQITNLFNEIDEFSGRRAFNIAKAGTYLLDVDATGPWNFTIEQPRPTTAEPTPQAFEGKGTNVTPFVTLKKGLNVFGFQRAGEGRGVFTLLDQDGRAVEQLANQLDEFHGSKPVKIEEDGIYFLNVYGEGTWTVTIE